MNFLQTILPSVFGDNNQQQAAPTNNQPVNPGQANTAIPQVDARPQAEALAQQPNTTTTARNSQVVAAELKALQASIQEQGQALQAAQTKAQALQAELEQLQAQEAASLQAQQQSPAAQVATPAPQQQAATAPAAAQQQEEELSADDMKMLSGLFESLMKGEGQEAGAQQSPAAAAPQQDQQTNPAAPAPAPVAA